jgi:hypothetical protein
MVCRNESLNLCPEIGGSELLFEVGEKIKKSNPYGFEVPLF